MRRKRAQQVCLGTFLGRGGRSREGRDDGDEQELSQHGLLTPVPSVRFQQTLRTVAFYGTNAVMLIGLPEPARSCSGPSTSVAPVAGSLSRFAMHSIAILCAFAICVFVA